MRYHYEKPDAYFIAGARTHRCNHPLYFECTLFEENELGLAVIQQRFNPRSKKAWWGPIDEWLITDIYYHVGFREYFDDRKGRAEKGLYPTVSIRQLMWALKMKPLKKERWETVFDRRFV